MKTDKEFVVYRTDSDGSERKATTMSAKSPGHAISIARRQGITKITEAMEAK